MKKRQQTQVLVPIQLWLAMTKIVVRMVEVRQRQGEAIHHAKTIKTNTALYSIGASYMNFPLPLSYNFKMISLKSIVQEINHNYIYPSQAWSNSTSLSVWYLISSQSQNGNSKGLHSMYPYHLNHPWCTFYSVGTAPATQSVLHLPSII